LGGFIFVFVFLCFFVGIVFFKFCVCDMFLTCE
jgi:cbb3-type cytochrome oxidase subunit 3